MPQFLQWQQLFIELDFKSKVYWYQGTQTE